MANGWDCGDKALSLNKTAVGLEDIICFTNAPSFPEELAHKTARSGKVKHKGTNRISGEEHCSWWLLPLLGRPGDMFKKKIRTLSASRINKPTLLHGSFFSFFLLHVDLSFPAHNQDCIIFCLYIDLHSHTFNFSKCLLRLEHF